MYEARRGLSRLVLGDREVERVVAFAEVPHPSEYMAISFACLMTQADVERCAVQTVRIYTDGSKIDGKVGASLSMWSDGAEIQADKLGLSAYCTVCQTGLLAIYRVTAEILKHNERPFGIFSDFRSVLEIIVDHGALHPLAVRTRANLRVAIDANKSVALFYIKAHAGYIGNECTDSLVKEAALSCRRKPNYDR